MRPDNQIIDLPLPLRLGRVNCYLLSAAGGFVLVDTGGRNGRARLLQALESAGCRPGRLSLILLTHGDFDHSGNAAYLRQRFEAKIAMHASDAGMVTRGDMFWNRQRPNWLVRLIAPLAFRLGAADRFQPDVTLEDGDDLAQYGLEATVVHLPGHSLGSIGVRLTSDGSLIGGDLLDNVKEPGLNGLMDDGAAAAASVEKLAGLDIGLVYPGHGRPFLMSRFLERFRSGQAGET